MRRIKTSVRWTLVPANGKSTEGFPRPAKRSRSAKRRRQRAREKMRGDVAYTTLSTQPSALWVDTRPHDHMDVGGRIASGTAIE